MMSIENENRVVCVKRVLGSVAVMVVPVHNQNALRPTFLLDVPGCDGNVVVNAESHPSGRSGMMARRTHRTECVPYSFCEHCIHGVQYTAGCIFRRFQRTRRDQSISCTEVSCSPEIREFFPN